MKREEKTEKERKFIEMGEKRNVEHGHIGDFSLCDYLLLLLLLLDDIEVEKEKGNVVHKEMDIYFILNNGSMIVPAQLIRSRPITDGSYD